MGVAFPLQDVLLQFTFVAALVLLVQFAFTRLNVPGLVGLLGPLVTRAAGERYARRRAAQDEGGER
jgi:hypothetical protein